MNENILYLKKEFERISKNGWQKSMRKGTTGIGYTFENLIGKKEDNFSLPDFNNIEIKTKHKYSKQFITLFNANPDGDYLFATEMIRKNYGYPDSVIRSVNIFQGSIISKKKFVGLKYQFKLSINSKDKKIVLFIYDKNNVLINNNISWSFELITEKLNQKMKYLAIIKADSKTINNIEFFKYNQINFYKLKNLDNFIKLIDNGLIRITFKIGVFRSKERYGNIHNHGTGFDINERDLLLLYDKIS